MRPVNHAAFGYDNDDLIFEALFKGVEVTKSKWLYSHAKGTVVHRSTHSVPEALYRFSLDSAWRHEKDHYGFPQLITFLPFARKLAKPFVKEGDQAWVCSDLAEYLARAAGIPFVSTWTSTTEISPGDLYDSIRMQMGLYRKYTFTADGVFTVSQSAQYPIA